MPSAFPPPPKDFSINKGWAPVWCEHDAPTGPEGQMQRIDRSTLERVVANCNARIAKLGTYSTVSLGHPKKLPDGKPDPTDVRPVVGVAGPYRLREVDGVCFIDAERHYAADRVEKTRDYPTVSVDFMWHGDEAGTGYFPNVALLPVGTKPRLNLGLAYQGNEKAGLSYEQPSSGERCLRYSFDADQQAFQGSRKMPFTDEEKKEIKALFVEAVKEQTGAGTAAQPASNGGASGAALPYSGKQPEPVKAPIGDDERLLSYEAENKALKSSLESLAARFDALTQTNREQHRRATLSDMRSEGYAMGDLDKEYEHYLRYDDELFEADIAHRKQYMPRAPLNKSLPLPPSAIRIPAVSEADAAAKAAEKNAKAKQLVFAAEREGKVLSYSDALNQAEKLLSGAA